MKFKKMEVVHMSMSALWKWLSFALFIIGMVFSVIGGIWWPDTAWIAAMLAVFGVIIGVIFAIGAKENNALLLASIALLVLTTAFSPITFWSVGEKIGDIVADFAALIAPIAIISAIKALILFGIEKK
jgi:hypothetical protein